MSLLVLLLMVAQPDHAAISDTKTVQAAKVAERVIAP